VLDHYCLYKYTSTVTYMSPSWKEGILRIVDSAGCCCDIAHRL